MTNKHGTRKYKCDQCQFAFRISTALKKHIVLVHQKVRNHLCEECGYAGRDPKALEHHKKAVHDKIQDEICPICQRAFALRHNMRTHMKTHKNPEEKRRDNLVSPYKCQDCPSGFETIHGLKTHISKRHGPVEYNQVCKEDEGRGQSQPEKETVEDTGKVSDDKTEFPQEEPMDLSTR